MPESRLISRHKRRALAVGLAAAAFVSLGACSSSGSSPTGGGGTNISSGKAKCDPNAPVLKTRQMPNDLDPASALKPVSQLTSTSKDLGTDEPYKPTYYNTLHLTANQVQKICSMHLTAVYLDWDSVLYNQVIRSGATDMMNALNIKLLRVTNYSINANGLQQDIQSILPLHPDIIITGGTVDPNQLAAIIKPAVQQGAEIVSWGVGAKGVPVGLHEPMLSLVGYDFYNLGRQMALAIHNQYPNGANLGYVHFINNVLAIQQREQGLLDGLKAYPNIHVIADGGPADPKGTNSGYNDPNAAQAATEAFLQRHPEVNVLFAPWEDPPALGEEAALKSLHLQDKVHLVTMDLGTTGAKQLKNNGTISVDMSEDVYDGGRAEILAAALGKLGVEPPKYIIIPTFAATKSNLTDAWNMMHGPHFPCSKYCNGTS